MPTQEEIDAAEKKAEEASNQPAALPVLPDPDPDLDPDLDPAATAAAPPLLPQQQSNQSLQPTNPNTSAQGNNTSNPSNTSSDKTTSSTPTANSQSTSNSQKPDLTGGPLPGSYKTPKFVAKLFNVGSDGIMGMIKNLFKAEWLKKKYPNNKKVLYPLLALNAVGAILASTVLIGVGAVTAGILKGTYDVFEGFSSILAEGIICATGTPPTSPFKPPHAEKFKKAGTTLVKGLAKFIVGSAIVAGIAMGGAGIAGVGVAAMLPVLTTIAKVISIGMLSLSSITVFGLSIWVANKVAKGQQEEVESKNKSTENQVTIIANRATTANSAKNKAPPLKKITQKGLKLFAKIKQSFKKNTPPEFDCLEKMPTYCSTPTNDRTNPPHPKP